MEVVWRCPGASLHQIVAALEGSGWSYSTIKTLVGRLVNKGLNPGRPVGGEQLPVYGRRGQQHLPGAGGPQLSLPGL